MLVFVPLLAGLWPLAHFVIVESKRELLDHANKLDKSAAQLKNITNELINRQGDASTTTPSLPLPYKIDMKLVRDLDNAAQRANNVAEDLRHAAGMLPDSLPSVWVYAFFAALAVATGHLIYQTSAPRTIQRYSLEEFQDEQVAHFRRNPTTDLINDADNRIKTEVSHPGTILNRKATQCISEIVDVIMNFSDASFSVTEKTQKKILKPALLHKHHKYSLLYIALVRGFRKSEHFTLATPLPN
jgi:hypothetical protein